MSESNKEAFLELWPKCFINFMGVIGIIAAAILLLTELGNVAANFWLTNVFAGGWAGIILLIHVILVFRTTCCKPGLDPAFHAAVLAVIGLIASAALISFDAAFIARPSVCILTPSCVDNSVSNSTFSYGFQQSFFTVFNGWAPFKNYGQSHVKFLCQTIQVGVGALSFILYIIYIVIYYSSWKKSKEQVHPDPSSSPTQPQTSRPQHPAVYPPYNAQLPYPIQPGYYPPQQPGPPNYYPPPQPPVPPGYPPVPPGYPPVQPPIPQGYPLAQQPVPQGYPPVQPPAPQGYPPAQPPPPAQSGYYPAPPRQYPPPGPPHAVWRPPMYGQQPVPGAVPWN